MESYVLSAGLVINGRIYSSDASFPESFFILYSLKEVKQLHPHSSKEEMIKKAEL
jgi:hypothetical protein